jgi:hypothetical protein
MRPTDKTSPTVSSPGDLVSVSLSVGIDEKGGGEIGGEEGKGDEDRRRRRRREE